MLSDTQRTELARVVTDAAKAVGVDLKGAGADVARQIDEGVARLALSVGEPGYDRAVVAERDAVWLAAARRGVETADGADLQVLAVIRGLLSAAAALA